MTAHGTVMVEVARLVNQGFGSHLVPLVLASRCVDSWDSDMATKDYQMFCKCYFGAMEDRPDVPAPCDFTSATKPKV